MKGTKNILHNLARTYGDIGIRNDFAITNTCIWMLNPLKETIIAIKNGYITILEKWSVADCTPEVISKIVSAIVFEIPISTENVDVITLANTVPNAEKKMTVVATKIITVELSFKASRNGVVEMMGRLREELKESSL